MSSVLSSAEDLISRVDRASPEDRKIILTDTFLAGKKLQDRASELEAALSEYTSKLSDSLAIINELRSEIKIRQNSESEALQASAVLSYRLSESENVIKTLKSENSEVSPAGVYRSELYRIDEKFTGEDRTLYPAFQKQIRIALAQNADRYLTLQSKITLIYQNLGIGPKSFLDRYLQIDGNFSFESLSEVWKVLDVSFRNPNEEEDARDALSHLRQGNKPFGAYLSEFQRLQNLSCITDDKTLIAYMRSEVSSNLNLCIGQQQIIGKKYTFDEFVALCKECVIRLDWMRPSIRGAKSPISYDLALREPYPLQPLGGDFTRNPTSSIASGANSVPLGGDPMVLDKVDLSHIGPDGHLTTEERTRRLRLGLCLRCGKPGHRVNKCQKGRKVHTVQELEIEEAEEKLNQDMNQLKD